MKTTDINTLTADELIEKVQSLESQLEACLQPKDNIPAHIKMLLFPIVDKGLDFSLDGDTARNYRDAEEMAGLYAQDISIIFETFVWAQLERQQNSACWADALGDLKFYELCQKLMSITKMYRDLRDFFYSKLREKEKDETIH